MKVKYEFINGESTEIEVDENVGTWILDSRRIEENLARKERYHCYSADDAWEGTEYADPDTPESLIIKNEKNSQINKALSALSETQRRRLIMYADGMSVNEIARIEGINPNAAWKSVEGARKKFIKNF